MIADIEENIHKKLDAIKKTDGKIRAFVDIFNDCTERAQEIAKKTKAGRAGKLAGTVISVKGNICIKGRRATCSSKMLENYIAPYNATVIDRLLAEDAIIIGSTNMDEFACGSDTTSSAFYPTRNPHDTTRVAGGSSGGAAASVAAGMCDAALGSDTGGSVRCPASFCGVTGMKPTYGTVSRYGLIDMAMSLEQIGAMTGNGKDAIELNRKTLEVIGGPDKRDAQCNYSIGKMTKRTHAKPPTIGIINQFFDACDKAVSNTVMRQVDKLGYEVMELSLEETKYLIPTYYLIMCTEFASAMQKYDGYKYGQKADIAKSLAESVSEARSNHFGKEVKRRILLGTYVSMKEVQDDWYTRALGVRKALTQKFEKFLGEVDLIASPTMPTVAWKIGEKATPTEMYAADILTVTANLTGLPAISVNAGEIGGLPVGMQLMGRKFEEGLVYETAAMAMDK
ncbi:Asp-tRNA(Asn)/Glu-tRNA(Gln) amidotransferase GatCAB subunit A [Candidatus Micrarchaeota archaeon CG_4_10_14_0_2_um_filter_49_7]|nr:MAG: Asp-tRNA(Asn)/Glu-tRNA(Gln) amidotransferase GatCAB subunit A [Candidatus Micrarchaeota archaeon CG_4_10_14_0_2_um_filter_49_7]